MKQEDCQTHLLSCVRILAQTKVDDLGSVTYADIYGSLDKQLAAVKLFAKLIQIREDLLKMIHGSTYQWGITGHSTSGLPEGQWGFPKFPYVKYIIIKNLKKCFYETRINIFQKRNNIL